MSDDQAAQEEASIRGFPVGVTVCGVLEDLRGWRNLGHWRLQDRLPGWATPGWEGLAEIAVVGVFGWDGLALPVCQPVGERPAPCG